MRGVDTTSLWSRGLHHASDLLIRRGSVMGPLTPILWLTPFFTGAAWAFRDSYVISGVFALVAIGIVVAYYFQYAKFAKEDPDRLQSEEYRFEIKRMQMIAAKELPYPVSADSLALLGSTSNPSQPLQEIVDVQPSGESDGH